MTDLEADFVDMVRRLVKPGLNILDSLTPGKVDALHMAVGISGEAGELIDAIKKWVIYNKELDKENVIEELGDLEFYMQGLRTRLGIRREDTLRHVVQKLSKRYEEGYSDKAAQVRADKTTE